MNEIIGSKDCKNCGLSFGITAHKKTKVYCSDACRRTIYETLKEGL